MDDSAEEVKLFDTEALEIGTREDEAGGVVFLCFLHELYGGCGSSANSGGDGGG